MISLFSFSMGPYKSILINDMGNCGTGKCKLRYWGSYKSYFLAFWMRAYIIVIAMIQIFPIIVPSNEMVQSGGAIVS